MFIIIMTSLFIFDIFASFSINRLYDVNVHLAIHTFLEFFSNCFHFFHCSPLSVNYMEWIDYTQIWHYPLPLKCDRLKWDNNNSLIRKINQFMDKNHFKSLESTEYSLRVFTIVPIYCFVHLSKKVFNNVKYASSISKKVFVINLLLMKRWMNWYGMKELMELFFFRSH